MIVTLVSCCGPKLSHAAPARDLYTSDMFRKSRTIAEASGRWFILSAKLGLVEPGEVIAPYDQVLPGSMAARRAWAEGVAHRFAELAPETSGIVRLLAGEKYCDPLDEMLYAIGWQTEQPLYRLGMGPRKRKLKEMALAASNSHPKHTTTPKRIAARQASLFDCFGGTP